MNYYMLAGLIHEIMYFNEALDPKPNSVNGQLLYNDFGVKLLQHIPRMAHVSCCIITLLFFVTCACTH